MTPHTRCPSKRQAFAFCSAACLTLFTAGCSSVRNAGNPADEPVPDVVTSDIDAGIRQHIREVSDAHGGFFPLVDHDKHLSLKLVKVHTEFLATLGPHEHFACIDLVDENGDVHDVDFFLHGDAGTMKVTRTIPHKLNGIPYYYWQENSKGIWETVPVSEASPELMGVIAPQDQFEFRYRAALPEITGPAKLWIPLAQSDRFQTVKTKAIYEPAKHQVLTEQKHGNQVLYWELGPENSGKSIDIRYQVHRIEKSAYSDPDVDPNDYLVPDRLVPASPVFQKTARAATDGLPTDLQKARALYDLVMDELKYAKNGTGWGQGDAVFACDARRGNCTDYHAYFIGLARSIGIPARFSIGAAIPSNRNESGVDGYHCWVEFYADQKWWPVDISEADKYSALSTYYFGHNPANRIELSRGRDLVVKPGPAAGPINFLAYPILEINNTPAKTKVDFSFKRTADDHTLSRTERPKTRITAQDAKPAT